MKRSSLKQKPKIILPKPMWLILALNGIHVKVDNKIIFGCESCKAIFPLTPAHRHPRLYYRKRPEILWDWEQVIILCTGGVKYKEGCHTYFDVHKTEKEELFKRLRGF